LCVREHGHRIAFAIRIGHHSDLVSDATEQTATLRSQATLIGYGRFEAPRNLLRHDAAEVTTGFRLGGLFKVFAAATIVGVVLLGYGGIQPPNDILISYAEGLVFLLIVIWVFIEWIAPAIGLDALRFKGPPVGAEIAQKQAEIAAAEKALASAT